MFLVSLSAPSGFVIMSLIGRSQRECPLWSKACRGAYQFLLKICESPLLIVGGIDTERISSLFTWKGNCLCWSWGVQQLMQRGSTVNFHMENSKDLTYYSCMLVLKLFTIDAESINSLCMWKGNHLCAWKVIAPVCEKVIASVDPGGLMINAERINSQLSHGKFKRFKLIFAAFWY